LDSDALFPILDEIKMILQNKKQIIINPLTSNLKNKKNNG
jgi:AICAR transformylase/IMP cyclohydrolase PurH